MMIFSFHSDYSKNVEDKFMWKYGLFEKRVTSC